MKLNRLTDYAVLVLWRLSQAPKPSEIKVTPSAAQSSENLRVLSAAMISEETVVPLPTVSKVLKLLQKQGLLRSIRGVNGGYCLARAAQDISVADIIEAIEGPLALTACVEDEGCTHTKLCGMSGNWDFVNQAVLETLRAISLTNMSPKPLSFM